MMKIKKWQTQLKTDGFAVVSSTIFHTYTDYYGLLNPIFKCPDGEDTGVYFTVGIQNDDYAKVGVNDVQNRKRKADEINDEFETSDDEMVDDQTSVQRQHLELAHVKNGGYMCNQLSKDAKAIFKMLDIEWEVMTRQSLLIRRKGCEKQMLHIDHPTDDGYIAIWPIWPVTTQWNVGAPANPYHIHVIRVSMY